jgi:hypothetical protein
LRLFEAGDDVYGEKLPWFPAQKAALKRVFNKFESKLFEITERTVCRFTGNVEKRCSISQRCLFRPQKP